MGMIEGEVNLRALREGFFNLGMETISLIPHLTPLEKFWENFYSEIEVDRISNTIWDGANFRLVYNKIDIREIKPIKPLLYSEYSVAGTSLSENENVIGVETIAVDTYAVRERFRVPINMVQAFRQPIVGFGGQDSLKQGLEYLKTAINSIWGIKIADLMNYILFRMITNGQVILRHLNTNHDLVVGSAVPITDITTSVTNRNWSGTDNPLISINDAINYLRKQTVITQKLPFFSVVVFMNQTTANKLINNANFSRLADNFELSAYKEMIKYIRYSTPSQVYSSVFKDITKEIVVINYQLRSYDAQGNLITEEAIPDNTVVVMVKHPQNLKLGMFALPYYDITSSNDLQAQKIKIPRDKFTVNVSVIGVGHPTELLVEYMCAVTGILVEPRFIAKYTIT